MIGDEFGMKYLAIFVFWSLISALILWLIYTLINNNLNSKSSHRRIKSQKTNKINYGHAENIQKHNGKKF